MKKANTTPVFIRKNGGLYFRREVNAMQKQSAVLIIYNNLSLSKQEQTEAKTFEQYLKTRYRQQDENRM